MSSDAQMDTSWARTNPFPGHWAGDVKDSLLGIVEVDTRMHLQLLRDEDTLTGWLYHTEGTIIYTNTEFPSCVAFKLEGEITEETPLTIETQCLSDEWDYTCAELHINQERVSGKITYKGIDIISIGVDLDEFEFIPDSVVEYEDFSCLY